MSNQIENQAPVEPFINATYSVEDNKIRLYASERLSDDLYSQVAGVGFKYAPIQKLFVAVWTPNRETVAFKLCGEIGLEGMTLAERAEAKAARLDALSDKRYQEACAFRRAANNIQHMIPAGQPILLNHHSQARSERAHKQLEHAQAKSCELIDTANYWQYRVQGVVAHANQNSNSRTRANRIKRLMADLRSYQRDLSKLHMLRDILEKLVSKIDHDDFKDLLQTVLWRSHYELYKKLAYDNEPAAEVFKAAVNSVNRSLENGYYQRWINHILNRLSYEYEEQGVTYPFVDKLTPTIIQTFFRAHGAEKPKAVKTAEGWLIESPFVMPIHLTEGTKSITLTEDEIKRLMVACKYSVPIKESKATKSPMINFEAVSVKLMAYRKPTEHKFIQLTKAEYKAIYDGHRGVRTSACGKFRIRICLDPTKQGYDRDWVAVFLTDSKAHPVPDSESVVTIGENAA